MSRVPEERPERHCAGVGPEAAAEPQYGIGVCGGGGHVPEIRQRHAAVPSGDGVETAGSELHRTTMANWIIRCAEDHLEPLWEAMHEELLRREVVHAGETVVQVLKENGRTAQSKSYMCYVLSF